MPLSRDEIYKKVQDVLVDTLGVDEEEVKPDSVLRDDLACRARFCAATTSHIAPNVQPASSRPSRTSLMRLNSMNRQL